MTDLVNQTQSDMLPANASSPTAHNIVVVARRLLMEHGFDALSFDSVSRKLGVDKGTIRYHFGNKSGLVTAVGDSLIHDSFAALLGKTATHSRGGIRVDLDIMRDLLAINDARGGWLDFLPYALRDPELMAEKARMYLQVNSLFLEWTGLRSSSPSISPALMMGIGGAITALLDGLAIQVGLGVISIDDAANAAKVVIDSTIDRLQDTADTEAQGRRDGGVTVPVGQSTPFAPPNQARSADPQSEAPGAKSNTADAIVAVARTLLMERGLRALSFEKVARAAGLHRDTVRYHFGNKIGLLTAVCESLVHDSVAPILSETHEPLEGRSHTTISAMTRRLLLANDARGGWLDVLPYALRDSALMKIHSELYLESYSLLLAWFGLEPAPPGLSQTVLLRFGAAACALMDGLAIQVGLGTISLDHAAQAAELILDSAEEFIRS